jgi:hypothetical protein
MDAVLDLAHLVTDHSHSQGHAATSEAATVAVCTASMVPRHAVCAAGEKIGGQTASFVSIYIATAVLSELVSNNAAAALMCATLLTP